MTTATFDSLQFAKNLGEGGFFNKEQAEMLAKTLGKELARQREEEAQQREADKAREAERDKEVVTKKDLRIAIGEVKTDAADRESRQSWRWAGLLTAHTVIILGVMYALFQALPLK